MGIFTTTRPVPSDYNPPQIRDVLARQKTAEKPESVTFDGYPIYADDPLRESHLLLHAYLKEAGSGAYNANPTKLKSGCAIIATPIEQWPKHFAAILARILFFWTHCVKDASGEWEAGAWRYGDDSRYMGLMPLAASMLRHNIPFAEKDLCELIDARLYGGEVGRTVDETFPLGGLLGACEKFVASKSLTPDLRAALTRLHADRKETFRHYGGDRWEKELTHRLELMLGLVSAERQRIVEGGEPWADAVLGLLDSKSNQLPAWEALLDHAAAGSGSKPSGKWLKAAKKLIDAIGADAFVEQAAQWLELAVKPRTVRLRDDQIVKVWLVESDIYSNKNEDVLKGLVWACGALEDPRLTTPLGALAEASYKKLYNVGPRSPKVGNACLISLIGLPGAEPRAELSRLKAKVKQPTAKKMIEKALGASASAAGMTVEDLEEQAIGAYGLTEMGKGHQTLGSFKIEIEVQGTGVEVRYVDSKSKARASVPVELKNDFPAELKQLQQSTKDLAKMLSAQRDRLERLAINRRELPFAAWRERYLDHFVVGTLARRLIWCFGDQSVGAWLAGKLTDANDRAISPKPDDIVRLWHPSGADANTVLAWRKWLEKHQITQPFKQAHREVYLLTDAERSTETYSNRFAAHILRQNVFAALCTQRGWTYKLMGSFDNGGGLPTLQLPNWSLRAEFWVNLPDIDEAGETGVARFVSTDQVRFYEADARQPMRLEQVPPIVLSEVMRDVDLFVGVGSVGNDPTWFDGGPDGQFREYWHHYSFGNLSATAQTRREVLERLLPRLKIANRCTLADRFLVVRGDKRTYKIHLGSGNILMEPNDQYLCIVPDARARNDESVLYLPFEGDNTLSIILSKAFLLVEDAKITDPTILRQID